jgi:hypothetical protein
MRTDKVIRVHASSWQRGRAFARESGRDIKDIASAALEAYIDRERARELYASPENNAPTKAIPVTKPEPVAPARTSLFPVLGAKL